MAQLAVAPTFRARAASVRKRRPRVRERPPTRAQRIARTRALGPSPVFKQGFRRELLRVVRYWTSAVRKVVLGNLDSFPTIRTDSKEDVYTRVRAITDNLPVGRYNNALDKLAKQQDRAANEALRKIVPKKITLADSVPGAEKAVRAFRERNLELVKDLVGRQQQKLFTVLEDSEGHHPDTLKGLIQDALSVTESRAELIARTETNKLASQVQQARQQAAGITRFTWTTAGDERVRESHRALDGKTFSYDDPPVVDGEETLPGNEPNCRCSASPVISIFDD